MQAIKSVAAALEDPIFGRIVSHKFFLSPHDMGAYLYLDDELCRLETCRLMIEETRDQWLAESGTLATAKQRNWRLMPGAINNKSLRLEGIHGCISVDCRLAFYDEEQFYFRHEIFAENGTPIGRALSRASFKSRTRMITPGEAMARLLVDLQPKTKRLAPVSIAS
jgi:hypothetical protein